MSPQGLANGLICSRYSIILLNKWISEQISKVIFLEGHTAGTKIQCPKSSLHPWSSYIILWVSLANFKMDIWISEWIGHCAWLKQYPKFNYRCGKDRVGEDLLLSRCQDHSVWLIWFLMSICSNSPTPLHFHTMHSSRYKVNSSLLSAWSFTLLLSLPGNRLIWLPLPHILGCLLPPAPVSQVVLREHKGTESIPKWVVIDEVFVYCFGLTPGPVWTHSFGWLNNHPRMGAHSKI